MLNSLKKPTAAPAKKPLTQAQRAEAVAAAVAAAEAAQAKKSGAKAPAPAAAASKTTAAAKTPASSDKAKEAKDAKETNGANGEEAKEEENGEDDKDDGEEEEKTEKGQSGEAKAAMKNMTGYQPEVERGGVDSTKLEKVKGVRGSGGLQGSCLPLKIIFSRNRRREEREECCADTPVFVFSLKWIGHELAHRCWQEAKG